MGEEDRAEQPAEGLALPEELPAAQVAGGTGTTADPIVAFVPDEEIIFEHAVQLPFGDVSLYQIWEPRDGFVYLAQRPSRRLTGDQVRAFTKRLVDAIDEQDTLSVVVITRLREVSASGMGDKLKVFASNMDEATRAKTMSTLNRGGFNTTTQPYDADRDPAMRAWEQRRQDELAALAAEQSRPKQLEGREQHLDDRQRPEGDGGDLDELLPGGLGGLLGRVRRRLGRAIAG